MEYRTEIINITKIKEGFFIGDKTIGTNLDVILQFKISHMINASGNQILNQFETIGVRYLTLNWSEYSSQKLFDSKDEIQNRIISFIDNAIENGEGLLVFSLKGNNRAYIIVIIYFMKKYFWSLNKCIEFLMAKKKDLNISVNFLKQLSEYEGRIKNKLSKDWYNLNNIRDNDEFLIRNTYLNSLTQPKIKNNNINILVYHNYNDKPHIKWGDNNSYNKYNGLIINNSNNDLILKKNIKDIVSHLRFIPKKKCIKITNQFYKYEDLNNYYNSKNYISNNINNINNYINNNENNKIEINNLINFGLNINIVNKINQINNNFNNLNLPRQKSNSLGRKSNKKIKIINNSFNIKDKDNYNDEINYSFQNKMKMNYDDKYVKKNNYFENMKQGKKNIYNKINNKKSKINSKSQNEGINNYNNNFQKKRPSTFDNNNNMSFSRNIKSNINNSNNLTNVSMNMINYSIFNKQKFFKNINNNNHSFTKNKNKEFYFEQKISKTQENYKIKKIINSNQNKMNNSANSFFNNNKEDLNDYYKVLGQSFNKKNNKTKNKKISLIGNKIKKKKSFNKIHNKIINSILNNNEITINNKVKKNKSNENNVKRSSTPNNLLPKQKYNTNYNINKNINRDNIYNNNNLINNINKNNSFNRNQKNKCK